MAEMLPAMFQQNVIPAHIAAINAETNIEARERIPTLSFRGKVWRVAVGNDENIIKNREGDPVASVNVIILNYNKARSRAYFEGAYETGKTTAPTCWSPDGKLPDPSIKEPQASACASCPMSVKGSKVSDSGKEMTACSQFKRVALVPAFDTKFQPLLLKLPQTSIWDKDAEEMAKEGFYAFDQYLDMLKKRNVNHTASVVTKVKFDARAEYPKLLFGPVDWTPAKDVANIQEQLAKTDEIDKILNVAPDGVPGEAAPEPDPEPEVEAAPVGDPDEPAPIAPTPPAPAPAAPKAAAAPKAPPAPPKPPKAAAKPPKPAAPPPPAGDPDDPAPLGAAAPAPKAAQAPAAPAAVVTGEKLGGLLAAWDD